MSEYIYDYQRLVKFRFIRRIVRGVKGMNLSEWMNTQLTDVVTRLDQSILSIHTEGGLNLACRHDIYEVLDDLLAVLFPGYHSTEKISHKEMNFFLNDKLRHISFKLSKHIKGAFHYHCLQEHCKNKAR